MRVRGVAQNSALALVGDLASKGGLAAVTVVAARGLSTTQFALLAAALALATVLTQAFDLGSQTLLTRDGVGGPPVRGELLRASILARLPLFGLALLAATAIGVGGGHLLEALATVLIAATGAVQLSLTGALRSAQDLRPEALAKLAGGVLMLGASAICIALAPRAGAILLAVAVANLLATAPMLRAARSVLRRGRPIRCTDALRRAAPLGAMTLATLVYYRSGTIALSLFSTSTQTARFATASTVAWGLLVVANAVTTGLLPRLADASGAGERAAVTRRALVWATVMGALLGGLVAAFARPLLTVGFGARYASAAGALTLLALATVLIAPAGVLGTALIAAGRVRPLCIQVGASLLVNLLVLGLLVPALGAPGAATATIACETVALILVARAAARTFPDLLSPRGRARAIATRAAAQAGR